MKKTILLILAVAVVAGTGLFVTGCRKPEHQHETPAKAGKYTCPMHPQIVTDKPGECPICHMTLVPVTESQSPSGVRVSPAARQAIGLKLDPVESLSLQREVRAAARIVADETKLYHVTVKLDGWVEHLFAATTGQYVKQGEPLLTIYSPELLAAQREYLTALQSGNASLLAAAKRRLELWDITDAQIAQLQKTGEPERVMTLHAPASGWVIERNIAAGHKVMAGEMLLTLADLTTVWADAAIFQDDIAGVTTGATVEVTVGRETFTGKVSFIAPTVDAETRTIKVRLQIPNPDAKLKPEMWATARLRIDLGERLAIPAAAVMRTGEQTYAFKDTGDGQLTPVAVRLGARAGEWFELLDGLATGDQVVTSANFLIDSEAQVKGALAGMGRK
jgi:Cu(I)/Ag(I) efflux system membrane fusion protein